MNDSQFKNLFRQFIDSCILSPQGAGALLQRILAALESKQEREG